MSKMNKIRTYTAEVGRKVEMVVFKCSECSHERHIEKSLLVIIPGHDQIDCAKCDPDIEDPNRGSGRSTAIILNGIAEAILNQGSWITIRDHYENGSSKEYSYEIDQIIMALDLKCFQIVPCSRHRSAKIRSTVLNPGLT